MNSNNINDNDNGKDDQNVLCDSIYQRRSIRKYKKDEISGEILEKILDAARVAPSGKNRQPWKFLVYGGEEKKEILKRGEIKTINEAVERMGLSRSAYYKYKDYVFPFYEASKEKIITLSLLLEHKAGVLSRVLNTVASDSGSIMTINQGIPLQGVANTTISIETKDLTIDLEALLDKLRMIDGVKRLEVLGQV